MLRSVGRIIHLLEKKDKFKYGGLVLANSSTSLLDLIGVLLSGITGVLAYSYFTGAAVPKEVYKFISSTPIEVLTLKEQLILFTFLIIFIFIAKSLISLILTYVNLSFLRTLSIRFSTEMYEHVMYISYLKLKKFSREPYTFALTDGPLQLFIGVMGSYTTVFSEVCFLLLSLTVLFLVDPFLAIVLTGVFGSLLFLSNRLVSSHIIASGKENVKRSIEGKRLAAETKELYREIATNGVTSSFSNQYRLNRLAASKSVVRMNFLQLFPKYFLEFITVVSGATLIFASGSNHGAGIAVGETTIYIATLLRLVPTLLRIQTALVTIQSGSGGIETTLKIFEAVKTEKQIFTELEDSEYISHQRGIEVKNLTFRYPNSDGYCAENLSLHLENNTLTTLIGRSGVGKSTLFDLILGFIDPIAGSVTVDGMQTKHYMYRNPGAIAIIPQDIVLIEGTILENIALGVGKDLVNQVNLDNAIKNSMLTQLINNLPDGLSTQVQENGSRLSGGQKQRIVIARALYTNPSYIFLDEPTSALDEETERDFIEILSNLKKFATLFVISHRKATLEVADKCFVLENGQISDFKGTLKENRILKTLKETHDIF